MCREVRVWNCIPLMSLYENKQHLKTSSPGWKQVDLTVYFHASACWGKWEGLFPRQCSANTDIYIMCNKLGKLVKWNICSACLNTEALSGYEFPLHILAAVMMSWEWVWKIHLFPIKKVHCFFSTFIIKLSIKLKSQHQFMKKGKETMYIPKYFGVNLERK